MARLWLTTVAVVLGAAAMAGAQSTDKSRYTILDPTPTALMRPMSADRPDVTESPYTVDAGHVQVELSFLEYVHDNDGGRLDEFAILPSNIKLGLLHNMDIQFVFEPYVHQRIREQGRTRTADGFGNAQIRLKVNLWGNDGGDTALGIMPYVQFPTADDDLGGVDRIEGGFIVPLVIQLPQDWTLALMGEVDVLRNEENDGYGVSLLHTASIARPIVGALSGYIEYVGIASHDLGVGYIALAGGGFAYGLSENVQLDGGVYVGISREADDVRALLGLTFRL